MTEYIEREAVNALIEAECSPKVAAFLNHAIDNIPAADVRPVVRAVWRRYSPFTDTYECSNCGEQVIDQQFRTNYCPNCGADMREEIKIIDTKGKPNYDPKHRFVISAEEGE